MLTISKLKRWSSNYHIGTAAAAEHAARDLARVGGGLGECYSERDTRTPVWLLACRPREFGINESDGAPDEQESRPKHE